MPAVDETGICNVLIDAIPVGADVVVQSMQTSVADVCSANGVVWNDGVHLRASLTLSCGQAWAKITSEEGGRHWDRLASSVGERDGIDARLERVDVLPCE